MGTRDIVIQESSGQAGFDITLQDIADSMEDDLLVIDGEFRIRFANRAASSRLRRGVESPVGKLCYQVFYDRDRPCGAPLWDCPLRSVLRSGRMTTVIHPARIPWAETYLKISAYPVRDRQGKVRAVLELRRDVTAERQLETQILRQHHRLLALNHVSSAVSGIHDLDSILTIALDNVLELVNGSSGGILLVDRETDTLHYRVHRGLSPKYVREMRIPLGEGIAGRVAATGEAMLLEDLSTDPRTVRPDLVSAEGLKGFASIPLRSRGEVVGVMNVASLVVGRFSPDDVSLLKSIGDYLGAAVEQARLYARLAEARQRYQALLQRALSAQEEERKRIARELHDGTSQALTSLTLNLKAIIEMVGLTGVNDPELVEMLDKTYSQAVHMGNEIVKLMKALRPTLLDELGLPAAIQRYAKDMLQSRGIAVTTEFKGMDKRLPSEVEMTFFRVAQGLIGNILEHSGARHASIRLECDENECVLRVEDDGRGFEVGRLTRVEPGGRGAGLFTMKERAKLVGGTCQVESEPGRGTRITVTVPLPGGTGREGGDDRR